MDRQFSIFKRYATQVQAQELGDLLGRHGIASEVANNVPPLDVTFSGSTINDKYEVRIRMSDFKKAEKVMKEEAEKMLGSLGEDHYLYGFSDKELTDILLKPDEWSELDYMLARKILEERGIDVGEDFLDTLKNDRMAHLAEPDEGQGTWVVIGYVLTLLGGFLGAVIGYFLWTAKKTLPNGRKVYTYSLHDRRHGKYMFYAGLIIFPAVLIWRLIKML